MHKAYEGVIIGAALLLASTPTAFAGGKSRRVSHSDMTVTKHIDIASPKLMTTTTTGKQHVKSGSAVNSASSRTSGKIEQTYMPQKPDGTLKVTNPGLLGGGAGSPTSYRPGRQKAGKI